MDHTALALRGIAAKGPDGAQVRRLSARSQRIEVITCGEAPPPVVIDAPLMDHSIAGLTAGATMGWAAPGWPGRELSHGFVIAILPPPGEGGEEPRTRRENRPDVSSRHMR